MCNARAWPQQCWKNGANGSNIAALRFDDHGTKKCWEMLTQQFDRFQTLHKNSHQHAPTRDRVCKRTQHVTSNNVGGGGGGGCWQAMLRPFAQGFTIYAD